MRTLPPWAQELLATPRQEQLIGVLTKDTPEEAEAQMFRIRLLHAYVAVRHEDPDSIVDPLLRTMVRLSDSKRYDLNLDDGLWVALFSVLRDNSAEDFAHWFNYHRKDFWLEPNLPEIYPWAYGGANGDPVERFPGFNEAVAEASASVKEFASRQSPVATGGPKVDQKQGGCYIATAVYGSYDAPPVVTLRHFRDERLARWAWGRLFIRAYYAVSPTLSKHFTAGTITNRVARHVLDAIVRMMERHR